MMKDMVQDTPVSVAVRDLRIAYERMVVLDGLSLDVRRGEFLVLLGSSGCGKSTLLNAIAGLNDVAGGSIHIGGQEVTDLEPAERGIGMVFQSYALYPRMTVAQNMGFGLRVGGMAKAEIAARVARVAAFLQIDHLLKRRPADLSGGQRQRVAIGRALVRDVEVFLFDEPLSNLDAQLRTDLRIEIKRLHQELGNTMIYVTHDQVEAMTLADRIAVMKDGRIQQLASPAEVYARPANLFVAGFLGTPRMNFLEGRLVAGPAFASPAFDSPAGRWSLAALPGLLAEGDRPDPDRPVVLGLRPEHLALLPEGAPAGPAEIAGAILEGTVVLTEPLGPETILWLDHGAGQVALRCTAERFPATGTRVRARLDLARANLFDKASGTRL